jgi:Flp pilus assembly protein TadG
LCWLGLLLLVPMLWILVSVFEVQRGAFAVSAAARAAGRAYALAPTDAIGRLRAQAAARQALDDQGLDGTSFTLGVACTPYPHACHNGTSVTRRPAADAERAGRCRRAELRPPGQPHRPDRTVPGDRWHPVTRPGRPP